MSTTQTPTVPPPPDTRPPAIEDAVTVLSGLMGDAYTLSLLSRRLVDALQALGFDERRRIAQESPELYAAALDLEDHLGRRRSVFL